MRYTRRDVDVRCHVVVLCPILLYSACVQMNAHYIHFSAGVEGHHRSFCAQSALQNFDVKTLNGGVKHM